MPRPPVAKPRAVVVTDQIAAMIVNGELKPGERLVEKDLAGKLRISRLPVREALRALTQEGLVTVIPRRGAFVTEYGAQEIAELYEVRAVLHGYAARLAAQSITAERLDELDRVMTEMREAVAQNDPDTYAEIQFRMRSIIFASAPNSVLRELISRLWRRAFRYRFILFRQPGRLQKALQLNEILLQAVKNHDGYKAERVMWLVVEDSKQDILTRVLGEKESGAQAHDEELPDLSRFSLPKVTVQSRK